MQASELLKTKTRDSYGARWIGNDSAEAGDDGGGVGVPRFAVLVRGGEGGGGVDGLVAGVGDEVNVCVGELAADEAELSVGDGVVGRKLEVGLGGFGECVGEVGLVGDKGGFRRIEKLLRQSCELGDGLALRIDGRRAADGDDFASGGDPGCDLLRGSRGDAIGGRKDEDRCVPRPTLLMASASM